MKYGKYKHRDREGFKQGIKDRPVYGSGIHNNKFPVSRDNNRHARLAIGNTEREVWHHRHNSPDSGRIDFRVPYAVIAGEYIQDTHTHRNSNLCGFIRAVPYHSLCGVFDSTGNTCSFRGIDRRNDIQDYSKSIHNKSAFNCAGNNNACCIQHLHIDHKISGYRGQLN